MSRTRLPRVLVLVLSLAVPLALVALAPAEAASSGLVSSAPSSTGAVALTFDDGWNRGACRKITDTLRAHRVVGTFFINGKTIKAAPGAWRNILAGMPVANHTLTHKNLRGQQRWVIRREIVQNEIAHERILGRPMLKLFRPPYGAYDKRVLRVAGDLGYRYTVLWNVQPDDWTPATSADTIVRRATGARPGSIILLHCRYWTTTKALPRIIRHYKGRGIKLVGLDELLGL